MKRMDLYIAATVVPATLLAWLVVLTLDAAFAFLGELGDIGRGNYALADAAVYILYTLPHRAYGLFPMAALIGTLLGLGGLAAQSELNALRLAGCSPARLTGSVLLAGVLMLLAVVAVGEGWAPLSQQLAGQVRAAALTGHTGLQKDFGFWLRDGRRVIRVGSSQVDGSLADIEIYELAPQARLVSASRVARAQHTPGGWQLEALRSSRFSEQTVELESSDSERWPDLLDPGLARLLTRDPLTLSLRELSQYIAYLQRNGNPFDRYRLAWWQRLASPLMTLAMLFLAVSLVLSRLGRHGAGQRILAGVVLGLLFKLLGEITAPAGLVYGIAPWASTLWPAALVLAGAFLLLRRAA